MPDNELPATGYAILGLLAFTVPDGLENQAAAPAMSGYEVKQRADRTLRYYWVSPAMSQIYTELRRLSKAGLVETEGRGRATRYQITAEGLRQVREWMFEQEPGFQNLKHPIALRLLMGRLSTPQQLKSMLAGHVDALTDRSGDLAAVRESLGDAPEFRYAAMVADWGLAYYSGEQDILRDLMARLQAEIDAQE